MNEKCERLGCDHPVGQHNSRPNAGEGACTAPGCACPRFLELEPVLKRVEGPAMAVDAGWGIDEHGDMFVKPEPEDWAVPALPVLEATPLDEAAPGWKEDAEIVPRVEERPPRPSLFRGKKRVDQD